MRKHLPKSSWLTLPQPTLAGGEGALDLLVCLVVLERSLLSSHPISRWVRGTEKMLTKVTPSLACHPLNTGSSLILTKSRWRGYSYPIFLIKNPNHREIKISPQSSYLVTNGVQKSRKLYPCGLDWL